ncbi:hypothetical protein KW785_00165 [Candidatus Parcubacteria bacterium]|nr:hypothetical protein [Candidatus Parcubacteria bacterium]
MRQRVRNEDIYDPKLLRKKKGHRQSKVQVWRQLPVKWRIVMAASVLGLFGGLTYLSFKPNGLFSRTQNLFAQQVDRITPHHKHRTTSSKKAPVHESGP